MRSRTWKLLALVAGVYVGVKILRRGGLFGFGLGAYGVPVQAPIWGPPIPSEMAERWAADRKAALESAAGRAAENLAAEQAAAARIQAAAEMWRNVAAGRAQMPSLFPQAGQAPTWAEVAARQEAAEKWEAAQAQLRAGMGPAGGSVPDFVKDPKTGQWTTRAANIMVQQISPYGGLSTEALNPELVVQLAQMRAQAAQVALQQKYGQTGAPRVDAFTRAPSVVGTPGAPAGTGYASRYVAPALAWGVPDPRIAPKLPAQAQLSQITARITYLQRAMQQYANVLGPAEKGTILTEIRTLIAKKNYLIAKGYR